MSEYWRIAVEEALDAAQLVASKDQIDSIAQAMADAHEMHSEAHGHHLIESPLAADVRRLNRALEYERTLIHCRECDGRGRIVTHGPYHWSDSYCFKCQGKGRHP